jgi:CHAP domain
MNKQMENEFRIIVDHAARGLLVAATLLAGCTQDIGDDDSSNDDTSGDVADSVVSPASATCGTLGVAASLTAGQSLQSCKNGYRLSMQTDGNLVLYTSSHYALWSSRTNGKGGQNAVMQGDGNFVVYTAGSRDEHQALWASGTNGHPGATLAVQDDGNVVIYENSKAIWATHTVIITGDDYPSAWKTRGQDSFATVFGLNRECVSFAAWKIYKDSGGQQVPTGINPPSDWANHSINVDADWGNASNWSAFAAATGVRKDQSPTAGSIAQWNLHNSIGMIHGHVAVVKTVNSDGSIDIEQYNLRNNGLYSVLHMPKNSSAVDRSNGKGPWTVPWPDNFIHIHGR